MRFELQRLRLQFIARDSIRFPEGKGGNIVRGALGMHLAPAIFRPVATAGPSGLANPPRPFVLRCRSIEGRGLESGESFCFDVHLFRPDAATRDSFVSAFGRAAEEGIGPGRGRAVLKGSTGELISVDLDTAGTADCVRIEFLTPTELKHEDGIAERPEFSILFARVRDRIASLCALYGEGAPEIDFKEMARRASEVRLTEFVSQHISRTRRSSRTGEMHPIGGFIGTAEYEGPLGEFLPWLEAARWAGVGRQAVWGKGEISLTPF